jgi:hypothetical protein
MHLAMQASLSPQVLPSVALANEAVVLASPWQPEALAVVAEAFEAQQPEALAFDADAFDAHSVELAREALALEAHSDEPALAFIAFTSPWHEPSETILVYTASASASLIFFSAMIAFTHDSLVQVLPSADVAEAAVTFDALELASQEAPAEALLAEHPGPAYAVEVENSEVMAHGPLQVIPPRWAAPPTNANTATSATAVLWLFRNIIRTSSWVKWYLSLSSSI